MTIHFHNDAAFVQTVDLASEKTGCPAALVEKDYWLTTILRVIAGSEHGEHSVFKGGTSLWKAFKLIQRFSEDIDILLDDIKFPTIASKKKKLSRIRQLLNDLPDMHAIEELPWFQGEDHATFVYGYEAKRADNDSRIYRAGKVILEIGFRGGTTPNMPMSINSMIGELAIEHGGKVPVDLTDFKMMVLAPERTFIEKLYAIDNAFRKGLIARRTRHFYDVHKLFGTTGIQQFLKSKELLNLSGDIREKTQRYYGQQAAPTMAELATSEAFNLKGEYYAKVEQGYNNDRVLYYQETIPFAEIAKSISQLRTTLSQK